MITSVPYLYVNVIAFTLFLLAFLAFLAAEKTPEIKAFIQVLLACMVWQGSAVLMRLQFWPGMKVWFAVSLVCLFSMEFVFYNFVVVYSHQRGRLLNWIFGIGTLLLIPGTVSGYFLEAPKVVMQAGGGYTYVYSVNWHIVIPGIWCIGIIIATAFTFNHVLKNKGPISSGIWVIIAGGVILAIGNIMQVALPNNTFPYDALAGIFFGTLLMIAMYRMRLFRTRLVVSRGILVGAMGFISLFLAIALATPLEKFAQSNFHLTLQLAIMVSTFFVSIITLLCYVGLDRLIDNMFSEEEKQEQTIKQYSDKISGSLSSHEIMDEFCHLSEQQLPIEKVYIFLKNGSQYECQCCNDPLATMNYKISDESAIAMYLNHMKDCFLVSEIQENSFFMSAWKSEEDLFQRLNIECVMALKDDQSVIGIAMLGEKKKKRPYSYAEIGFLQTICSVTSIGLKNAWLYEKMFREARIDALTGAYNYRCFMEDLDVSYTDRKPTDCMSLMFVDIDDFKLYNQLYGTEEGNEMLRKVRNAIQYCAGTDIRVYRSSGKVFALILKDKDARHAYTLATVIAGRVRSINQDEDNSKFKELTVSIGICSAPTGASSSKELMDNADLATYNAKRTGKNKIVIFHPISRLSKELFQRTEEIMQDAETDTTMYTVSALTAAIDAKDHYTYAHSKNVARYATSLAVAAGLNNEMARTVYSAGLLHDIGKISIPESILRKTDKLDDEEYTVIKEHVNNAIDIIRYLPDMDYLIPAVLGHHERWDGHGYPRGISGNDIPVTARCLAIADAFDAMTTDRPYRKGLSTETALEQIKQSEGTQLDPALSEIFIDIIRKHEIPVTGNAAMAE